MRYIPAIYAATLSDGRYAEGKEGSNKYAALMDGGTIDVHGYTFQGFLRHGSVRPELLVYEGKGLPEAGALFPRRRFLDRKHEIHHRSDDDRTQRDAQRYI